MGQPITEGGGDVCEGGVCFLRRMTDHPTAPECSYQSCHATPWFKVQEGGSAPYKRLAGAGSRIATGLLAGRGREGARGRKLAEGRRVTAVWGAGHLQQHERMSTEDSDGRAGEEATRSAVGLRWCAWMARHSSTACRHASRRPCSSIRPPSYHDAPGLVIAYRRPTI